MYQQVVPYVVAHGLGSWDVNAGCARCQACSAMAAFERTVDAPPRPHLPLLQLR
jgi:hypothetical protein